MTEADAIIEQATAWHLASQRADMDWAAFTAWLEADPRHRTAYDEIALADAAFAEHRGALASAFTANDDEPAKAQPRPGRRWGWAGGAVAASLAAALAVQQFIPGAVTYQTEGTGRTIALADGSTVELAPNSRLEVDGQELALAGGAWFDIRHDPNRQLTIRADGIAIGDIGTKFDVQASGGQVRVEVAEGRVRVSGQALAKPVDLSQGQALAFDPKGGIAAIGHLADGDIGEWRSGRLTFQDAPLALVAADLSRYAGVKVTVAENLEDRHFTGTLVIGDGKSALRDLSQLMGLGLGRSGDGYRLEPGTS
jgi:transmembrane sensor